MANNNNEEIEEIEKKRTEDKMPPVIYLFFIAGIVFLIVYVIRFTPAISGWTSEDDYLNPAKKPKIEAGKTTIVENPFEHNSTAINEGKSIFSDYCADCHAEDAKGDFGPDLTDSEWKYGSSDEEKFNVVTKGRGADTDNEMPSFNEDLKEEQIWKVLAFIDSLK